MKDYYKILGVEKGASEADIKQAYRKMAHRYHPDKQGGDEQKFKEVNEAYQVLSSKEKRQQYDRFGTAEPFGFGGGPSGNPFGGFGFDFEGGSMPDVEDLFEMFFGGAARGGKRRAYRQGSDLQYAAMVDLEEVFAGTKKTIVFPTQVACGACEGLGYDKKAGMTSCTKCGGRGEVKESKRTFFGNFTQVKECRECRGAGEAPNKPCAKCSGTGRVKGERRVTVEILPGVADGQIIRVAGAGEVGERGAGTGDLYIKVGIKPQERFRRQGNDLLTTVRLSVIDLLLGTEITVKGISGKPVKIVIPSGFNLREAVTVPGEGMPVFGAWGRGNMIVSFDVVMPKKISKRAKEVLEKIREEME